MRENFSVFVFSHLLSAHYVFYKLILKLNDLIVRRTFMQETTFG